MIVIQLRTKPERTKAELLYLHGHETCLQGTIFVIKRSDRDGDKHEDCGRYSEYHSRRDDFLSDRHSITSTEIRRIAAVSSDGTLCRRRIQSVARSAVHPDRPGAVDRLVGEEEQTLLGESPE